MCWAFGLSFVTVTARVMIISLIGHRLLNDLKFNFIEIGFSYDLNPFRVCWMGKFDGNKSKVNSFWLFITLERNVILTVRMYCGLKVLLWEAGRPAGRVLEELELKPTQPPTVVGLGLGFGLSLAISKLESMSDGSETYFILSLDPIKSLWEPTTVSEPINPDTI